MDDRAARVLTVLTVPVSLTVLAGGCASPVDEGVAGPERIDGGGGAEQRSELQLCTHPDGTVTAAWLEWAQTGGELWTSRLEADRSGWAPAARVSDQGQVVGMSVACGPEREATFAWKQLSGPGFTAWSDRTVDGETFLPEDRQLHRSRWLDEPHVVATHEGAFVSFTTETGLPTQEHMHVVGVRLSADGPTPLLPPAPDAGPGVDMHGLQLAARGSHVVALWRQSGEGEQLVVSTSVDGGVSFGPARVVALPLFPRIHTHVCAGDQEAFVVWASPFRSGTWARRVTADELGVPIGLGESSGLVQCVRDDDRTHVVWLAPDGTSNVLLARTIAGRTVSEPRQLGEDRTRLMLFLSTSVASLPGRSGAAAAWASAPQRDDPVDLHYDWVDADDALENPFPGEGESRPIPTWAAGTVKHDLQLTASQESLWAAWIDRMTEPEGVFVAPLPVDGPREAPRDR